MYLNMPYFRNEFETEEVCNNFGHMIDYRCNAEKGR